MHPTRRTVLAATTGALAATAGCLDFLSGTDEYASRPAVVDPQTASDNQYEKQRSDDQVVERTFSGADQERTVEVTNWATAYHKTVSVGLLADQKAAVFATFTSPEVSVLGQDFNPIQKMGTKDLAKRVQGQYDGLEIRDEVDATQTAITGTQTKVSTFDGTATFNGQEIDVFVVVSEPVKHDGDYVLTMAVYPQEMDGEHETIGELMQTLQHPTDPPNGE